LEYVGAEIEELGVRERVSFVRRTIRVLRRAVPFGIWGRNQSVLHLAAVVETCRMQR